MNIRRSAAPLLAALVVVVCSLLVTDQPAHAAELASASDFSFHSRVINSTVPVLVEFWAPWCVPCRQIEKSLETVAAELGSRARIIRVNIEHSGMAARRYNITSLPTTMVFDHGQVVERVSGALTPDQIRDLIATPTPTSTTALASLSEQ